MNALKSLSLILLLSLASTGCHNKSSKTSDFNLLLYAPEYTSGFDIKRAGEKESVLIAVRNPWQGVDSIATWLFVVHNGGEVPEGFAGQVFKEDVKRIVVMSFTHITMLDAIGEVRRITGVSGIDYISNPDIQIHRDSIGGVGYKGDINYELLFSFDPDLVLLYGMNDTSVVESKLEEPDIPFMYIGDYLEESPLNKAEWMVVSSGVTGKCGKGEKVLAVTPVGYNALRRKVADSTLGTPSIMLNVPYGDSWFMPSTRSYIAHLITDAGGRYIYQKSTGNVSISIDLEEAYLLASDADAWLNMGMADSLDDLKTSCPKLTDTRCFKNEEVYNNDARTNTARGNDYYKSVVVNPDIVLRDLVKILHPELVQEECMYYKRLKQVRFRSIILFSILVTLTVGLFSLDLAVGVVNIPIRDVWATPTGRNYPHATEKIILNICPIKAIVAPLAGAALSVSGLQMQILFRNSFADPYAPGISSGASPGVALVVLAGIGSSVDIVGAVWVGVAIVLLVITAVGQRIKDIMVILILGMMFSSGVGVVMQISQYLGKEGLLKAFAIWTMGALGDVTFGQLLILVPSMFAGLLLAVLITGPLNLLLFGEEYAVTMGLNIRRSRSLLFLSTTLPVGTITAFCDPVGLIGLVMSHVTGILFQDSDHHILLPGTILPGASILLLCDIIFKTFTLSVNAATALLGTPIVVWVVLRNKSITTWQNYSIFLQIAKKTRCSTR